MRLLYAINDPLDVGPRKHIKVLGRQMGRPGVKDLHRLRAIVCLQQALK